MGKSEPIVSLIAGTYVSYWGRYSVEVEPTGRWKTEKEEGKTILFLECFSRCLRDTYKESNWLFWWKKVTIYPEEMIKPMGWISENNLKVVYTVTNNCSTDCHDQQN